MSVPTSGAIGQVTKRLLNTYRQVGGTRWNQDEVDKLETEGMSPFEVMKYKIAKKIQFTREKMKERDDLVASRRGGAAKVSEMNHQVRVMIRAIKDDFSKIEDSVKRYEKKTLLHRPKPEILEKKKESLEIIRKHVQEIEALDKNRHKAKNKKNDGTREALYGDSTNEDGNEEQDESGGKMKIAFVAPTSLPDDPTATELPEIDISEQLQEVEQGKKKVDEVLDRISGKLDILAESSKNIGDELQSQNKLLDKIETKTDKTTEKLEKEAERLQKQVTAVSKTTIYIVIIIFLILLIVLIIIGYVLISHFFIPGGRII